MGILAKLEAVSSNNARIASLYKKGEITYREAISAVEVGVRTSKNYWSIYKPRMEHSDAGLRSVACMESATCPVKTVVNLIIKVDPDGFKEGKYWF